MANNKAYKWIFPARFRAGAYGWKSSRLVCQRLREAVSEIKKVAKKDPVLGAEGAVRLIEKVWPAPNLNRYSATRRVARALFMGSARTVLENASTLDFIDKELGQQYW